MPRHAQSLTLTPVEEEQLTARVRDRRSTQQTVLRARIVLLSAQHWENQEIAAELTTTPHTVGVWRRRFARERLEGLEDTPRSGRPVSLATATVAKVLTTVTRPPKGRTRWMCAAWRAVPGCPRAGCINFGKPMTSSPTRCAPSSYPWIRSLK